MSGIAHSLVVLAEVRTGCDGELRAALEALEQAPSPFAGAAGTHFGRWAQLRALPGVDGEPLAGGPGYLLLCVDTDLSLLDWSRSWCERSGPAVDAVMSWCVGWPGSADPEAVAEYLAEHHARPGFSVATHRRATVREIRSALTLRRGLRRLAVRAERERLSAAELRAAWREAAGA